jgi:hypothetical protein
MSNAKEIVNAYINAREVIKPEADAYTQLLNDVKKAASDFYRNNTSGFFESKYRWLEDVSYFHIDSVYVEDNILYLTYTSYNNYEYHVDERLTFEELDNIVSFIDKERDKYMKTVKVKDENKKAKRIARLEKELENLRSEN